MLLFQMHTKIVTIAIERVEIEYDKCNALVVATFHTSYHRELTAVILVIHKAHLGMSLSEK